MLTGRPVGTWSSSILTISPIEVTRQENDQNSSVCSRGRKHLSPASITQKAHSGGEQGHEDGNEPKSRMVAFDNVQYYNGDFEQECGADDAQNRDELLYGTLGVICEGMLIGFTVDTSDALLYCFNILFGNMCYGS